jgi:hypothetical protein
MKKGELLALVGKAAAEKAHKPCLHGFIERPAN